MKSILIVDDEYDIVSSLEMVLTMEGFIALTAFNGTEALDRISKMATPPDLIISDLMMPNLDGYGLVRTLQGDPKLRSIPILLMSAAQPDERLLIKGSSTTFVRKPFELDRFIQKVQAILGSSPMGAKSARDRKND